MVVVTEIMGTHLLCVLIDPHLCNGLCCFCMLALRCTLPPCHCLLTQLKGALHLPQLLLQRREVTPGAELAQKIN